jgi:hypothetical protein
MTERFGEIIGDSPEMLPYTRELLRCTDGNRSEGARPAGFDRSNFGRLLRRHEDEA